MMKNSKKSTFLFIYTFVCVSSSLFSQVGINNDNTSPHPSAQLDVKSVNKGLLIPRMNSTQREQINNPAQGLMVYDTVTNSYWYFNGSIWINLNTSISTSNFWSTIGNFGINPSSNFLGTLDDQPLKFKINNIPAGEINSFSNTSLGMNASIFSGGSQNTAIGAFSLTNNTGNFNTSLGFSSLYSNVSGHSNVAIGSHAAYFSTSKNNIVAIGDSALYNNGTNLSEINANLQGIANTAIGSKSLFSNKQGSYNTAVGFNAQKSSIGSNYNTSIGYRSMADGLGGVNNTAIGMETLKSNEGWFNTAVGNGAMYNNMNGYYNAAIGNGALSNVISGNYNTGVGHLANVSLSNLENATAIGAFALANCSNCLILGGVNGVNGANSNVNVGIGINSPNASLSVARGTGADGTAVFAGSIHSSHFNYGGAEATYIRGGKDFSPVIINDGTAAGNVNLAEGGGNINLGGIGNVNLISNKLFAPQTGGLNLAPIGIISMNIIFRQDGTFVTESNNNIVGNVYLNWNYSTSINTNGSRDFEIYINHNPTAIAGYSNIITIGDLNFSSNLYQTFRARKLDLPGQTKFIFTTQNVSSLLPYAINSTFIIYGIK